MSLADQILNEDDRTAVIVECPEWGFDKRWSDAEGNHKPLRLEVRSATPKERTELARKCAGKTVTDAGLLTLIYVTYVPVLDEHGEPIPLHNDAERVFTDDHLVKLQTRNSAVVDRIGEAFQALQMRHKTEVQDAQKN